MWGTPLDHKMWELKLERRDLPELNPNVMFFPGASGLNQRVGDQKTPNAGAPTILDNSRGAQPLMTKHPWSF